MAAPEPIEELARRRGTQRRHLPRFVLAGRSRHRDRRIVLGTIADALKHGPPAPTCVTPSRGAVLRRRLTSGGFHAARIIAQDAAPTLGTRRGPASRRRRALPTRRRRAVIEELATPPEGHDLQAQAMNPTCAGRDVASWGPIMRGLTANPPVNRCLNCQGASPAAHPLSGVTPPAPGPTRALKKVPVRPYGEELIISKGRRELPWPCRSTSSPRSRCA